MLIGHHRPSDRIQILVDVALVQRHSERDELSMHRLVQAEFRYSSTAEERQAHFNAASKLLYEAFPKQRDERFGNRIPACDKIIGQVYTLRDSLYASMPGLSELQPPDEFCMLMRNAAWYCVEVHHHKELESTVTTAMKAVKQTNFDEREPEHYAQLCNCASRLWAQRGDFEMALQLMEQALSIRKSIDDDGIWGTYNNLGNIYYSMGLPHKALEMYEECRSQFPDEEHFPRHALRMYKLNVGRTYTVLGRLEEAEELIAASMKLNDDWLMGILYVDATSNTIVHWIAFLIKCSITYHHGVLYRAQGKLKAATEALNRAANDLKEHNMLNSLVHAVCLYKLGCIEAQSGRMEQARYSLRHSIK